MRLGARRVPDHPGARLVRLVARLAEAVLTRRGRVRIRVRVEVRSCARAILLLPGVGDRQRAEPVPGSVALRDGRGDVAEVDGEVVAAGLDGGHEAEDRKQ